jgi:multidrug transporter EmrE-like cation transporter
MNINFVLIILFASLLEYLGDSNFKFYARENENKYLIYGGGSYILMVYILIKILRYSNVMYMNIMWDATSIILETVLAYILLGEYLDNRYQMTGFIFIVAGIILLNVGKIPY